LSDGEPGALTVDPQKRFLFAAVRSTGKLAAFRMDRVSGRLTYHNTVAAGPDPAHISTDHAGRYLLTAYYVAARVTVHAIGKDDKLSEKPPAGFKGTNACAEIKAHSTGRFVYVSNRGHDSIAAFALDSDGKLSTLGQTPTEKTPRSFDIDPSDAALYRHWGVPNAPRLPG
jgi:6-phosphogluconolactonase